MAKEKPSSTMVIKTVFIEGIAQLSYLIGDKATGKAVVIDPHRDVEVYIELARENNLSITHALETHIHADFVSGSRELVRRAGATLLLSDEGPAEWKYAFAKGDDARLLRDGFSVMIGRVKVEVLHTPGHTPEHLSFLVTDTASATEPMGLLSGDFLFVGEVGRPDLLERAANVRGSMQDAARQLFRSLQRVRDLPDFLQLWPGHGAGSACGKALGAVPQSTLGYEKRFNWAFAVHDEHEFARTVLAGQPDPPAYFAEMKRVNKAGPAILGTLPDPPRVDATMLRAVLDGGATVVDLRDASAYAEGHLVRTLSIPLNKAFPTWAGSLLRPEADLYLLGDEATAARAREAARDLALIGFDRVRGVFGEDALRRARETGAWRVTQRRPIEEWRPSRDALLIDVRAATEFAEGHLDGALNVPVATLAATASSFPADASIFVHCQAGARSAMAAAVLEAQGRNNVTDLTGGFGAWVKSGGAVVRD